MNRIIGCVRSSLSVPARRISISTNLAKANAGKAKNYGVPGQNRKQWYWVTLKSMAGTGNTMTWVRHEKDPKVVILHPDPKLDKNAYPDNKVLWVETKRGEKVWPYNLRQMKFIMGQVGDKRLIKDNPRYSAPWHRPMGADQVAERLNTLMQNQEEKTKSAN